MGGQQPQITAAWALLRDPITRNPLRLGDTGLEDNTGRHWPLAADLLPDLFWETGGVRWSRQDFDQHYEENGEYFGPLDYEVSQGGHPQLTYFRQRRIKDAYLDQLTPKADDRILDVGCGAGWFLEKIARKYAAAQLPAILVGAEASVAQGKMAAARLSRLPHGAGLAVLGNAEALPFADATFDQVTCSESLAQIRNPGRALAEMTRVLRPDGQLWLSVPSRLAERSWDSVLAPLRWAKKLRNPRGQVRDFTEYYAPLYPEELTRLVENSGLTVTRQEAVVLAPHPHYFRYLPRPIVPQVVNILDQLDRRWAARLDHLCGTLLVWAKKT